MATMSATRIRSLYRRHTQAHEAVYRSCPRTRYGRLSLGSRQPEPQKPRQRLPPTNASALLFARSWRNPAWPYSAFRVTSHLKIHRRTSLPLGISLVRFVGSDLLPR